MTKRGEKERKKDKKERKRIALEFPLSYFVHNFEIVSNPNLT